MPDRQENLAEKKKVSVVVPVYNAAPYLAECIDSLIAQTYQPEEIILVDDGSADESGNICDEYASCYSHIKVIHKKNEGVSAARNTGMDAAGGDYLVFVGSDDFVHHNLLEYYLNHLNENCVPVCRIWEAAEGTEKGMDNYTGETIYALEHFMKFFCADHVNSPCNKIYSVDILRRHHIYFPENMSLGEDLIFNLRYLKYAPSNYCVSTEHLYYHRTENQESLSSRFRTEIFDLQLYMFKQLQIFLQDTGVWSHENRGAYYGLFWNRLYQILEMYIKQQRKSRSSEIREYIHTILCSTIWSEVWTECKREGIITKKMMIKKTRVDILKIIKG